MVTLTHRLRHRIDVQTATMSRDSNGDVVKSWATVFAAVPAEVLEGPGSEALANGQVNSTVAARITIRYRAGISHGQRILWKGVVYHLETTYRDATARQWQTLVCSAGVIDE